MTTILHGSIGLACLASEDWSDAQAMDLDMDGKLNAGEFRAAMEKLGMTHLSGPVVSTIFSAMDIHGPLTLQEFLYIVEV